MSWRKRPTPTELWVWVFPEGKFSVNTLAESHCDCIELAAEYEFNEGRAVRYVLADAEKT